MLLFGPPGTEKKPLGGGSRAEARRERVPGPLPAHREPAPEASDRPPGPRALEAAIRKLYKVSPPDPDDFSDVTHEQAETSLPSS